jgi:tetratricopeptide (TPR) repeat protein
MPSSSSIASEYYKLQEMWRSIEPDRKWRLAIWSAKIEDIILVNKFLEVEQSPIGTFDDIFFRFETQYEGSTEAYNTGLWHEYISWFEEDVPKEYDIYGALKKDGLLKEEYCPDKTLEKTPMNLWKEMLRFKSCIEGLDDRRLCVCLSVVREDIDDMTEWYEETLADGIPEGIRLTVIDEAKNRKIKLKTSHEVVILSPKLNMIDALDNDMDKNCGEYNPVDPGNQFDKQLRETMKCATKKNEPLLTKEVNKLYACSKELNNHDMEMSTPLIASQAYYMTGSYDKSLFHVEKSISMSKEAMDKDEDNTVAYAVWKASMFQKGAILSGQKKREKAIAVYEELAAETTKRKDLLYIMESYRMVGYLLYEQRKSEEALQNFLLSLYAGSRLDVETRRQSTFLYSANLAMLLCREERGMEDEEILEKQLEEWLGSDWSELVESDRMKDAKKRRKSSVFN